MRFNLAFSPCKSLEICLESSASRPDTLETTRESFWLGPGWPNRSLAEQWELSEYPSSWSSPSSFANSKDCLSQYFAWLVGSQVFDMSSCPAPCLLRFGAAILGMFGSAGRPPEGAGKHRKRSRTWKIQSRLSTLLVFQAALLKHSGAPAQELNKQKVIWS